MKKLITGIYAVISILAAILSVATIIISFYSKEFSVTDRIIFIICPAIWTLVFLFLYPVIERIKFPRYVIFMWIFITFFQIGLLF